MSTVLIFDTETTGVTEPVLVEAAGIYISGSPFDKQDNTFTQRYNPEKPISYGAMATHHILEEDLTGCPKSSEFALDPQVKYLVGHNIDFDWRVIGQPDVKRIDTLAMARAIYPELDSYTLTALSYALSEPAERLNLREMLKTAHSALTDVILCLNLVKHIITLKGLHTWADIYAFSEESRIPKVMSFGKYKGMPISEVPQDYKEWLKKQPDIDE